MLSSWQIAALHSQQGQMFSSAHQSVQPLSAPMPSPYGGFSGPGPLSSPFGSPAFGAGPGPGFNYGAARSSSAAFGNMATSTVGGVGQAMFGGMGISGAMMGFSAGGGFSGLAGGGAGRVLGGAVMGGALGMGVGAVGSHVFGSMMEGAQEQQQLERTLSQFRFQNASARGGQGFSRQDQQAIGNIVRQMERMPEMLTSFGELNQLMDKMGQMGLMQGVKNVSDFMGKFKSTVSTLRDMAKIMGTTMEGALQAFGESRAAGYYQSGDILKNTVNRQLVSGLTGMSMQQTAALQQYGGEVSHARGGSRRGGAQAITRAASQFGMMNQMGMLTNDQIMEMTGKEGAEGLQDMAVQMGDLSYRMGRSSFGTAMTLALGKMEDGRYTGQMDEELVEKFRRGEISKGELLSMARSKAGTRGAKLSFAAHRARLTTEMANATGAEGQAMVLQSILGERGWDNPDAQSLVMQRFGASEGQANMLQQMMPNLEDVGLQLSMQRKQQARQAAMNQAGGDRSWDAIKKRISTKIAHYTTDWAKDLGVGVRDYFVEWADDFLDELSGSYRTEVTKRSSRILNDAMRGDASAMKYVNSLTTSRGSSGTVDASSGFASGLARDALRLVGETSPGEAYADQSAALTGGRFMSVRMKGAFGDDVREASAANLAFARMGRYEVTQSAEQKAQEQAHLRSLSGRHSNLEEQLKAQLSPEEFAALQQGAKDVQFESDVTNAQGASEKLRAATRLMSGESGMGGSGGSMRDIGRRAGRNIKVSDAWRKATQSMSPAEVMEAVGGTDRLNLPGGAALADERQGVGASFDAQANAKRIKDLNRSLSKQITGADGGMAWGELGKLIDEDTGLGRVIAGKSGMGGLLADQAKAEDILTKRIFSPDDRKYLTGLGMSEAEVTRFENDHETRNKLAKTMHRMSGEARENISTLLTSKDRDARNTLAKSLTEAGLDVLSKFGKDSGVGAKLTRETGGKSSRFMALLTQSAQTQSKIEGASEDKRGDVFRAAQAATSQLAEEYANLDPSTRKAIAEELREGGQEGLLLKLNERVRLKEKSKKVARYGKKGMALFGREGLLGGDETTLDPELVTKAKALAGDDGRVQANEEKAITELAKQYGQIQLSKPGEKAGAAGISEESVTALFKGMTDNNLKIAQILDNVLGAGGGKGEGEPKAS